MRLTPVHALLAVTLMLAPKALPAASFCGHSVEILNFSEVNLARGADITGIVQVSCFGGKTDFKLLASPGQSGNFTAREMSNAKGSTLRYNLFTDATRTTVWGDGLSDGTSTIDFTNNGITTSFMVFYGRVPPGQQPSIGDYTDSVVVTLRY